MALLHTRSQETMQMGRKTLEGRLIAHEAVDVYQEESTPTVVRFGGTKGLHGGGSWISRLPP